MSQEINPYQAPPEETPAFNPYVERQGEQHGLWADGQTLVLAKGYPLLSRCVKSNQPAEVWLKRKLQWAPQWLIVGLFLGGPLIILILYAVFSKRATIDIGLTSEWAARRRTRIRNAWILSLLGIAVAFSPLYLERFVHRDAVPFIIMGGVILFVVTLIAGSMSARMVYAKRISNRFVWIAGVCPEYLVQLPPWPRYE